ncbi:hypothetical protein [uncultured Pelagimonas sp.]|uniref:hypothetical protein n=1 Tax=uncultured Pelagimonas sp. TaxID=1618102 RepID=UPI00260982F2|nr:hypothetical protein [uncultured Pelagimonas sp.]
MKRLMGGCVLAFLAMPVFAAGADTLKMKFKVESGVHMMIGVFGSEWEPGQVQTEAAKNCGQIGKPLASFKVKGRNSQGLKVFEATCK